MNAASIARFWSHVDKGEPTACWLWKLSVTLKRGGYGQFRCEGKTLRAHKVAYELAVGPVPDGLVLDHICRNPRCVNPAHLDPVPHAENTRRGMAPSAVSKRTNRCARGHGFTAASTYIRPSGKRECRVCTNDAQNARRSLRSAA